jgi:nucleotide-binding universal stress UspA family protein
MMYKVIMAPTEGSESERAAISAAVKLARLFEADLRLVRVDSVPVIIEPVPRAPMLAATEESIREERLARLRKLEALGTECRSLGDIRVMVALEEGPTSSTLADYARRFGVDLIVMSSHARGGVRRITLGSVTDYLIRHTNISVLVVRPPASFMGAIPQASFSRIVVPLDGSVLAEQILSQVAPLASSLHATVSLLRVLTPVTHLQEQTMQPGLPWWDKDIAVADACLARAERYLMSEGIKVTKDVVLSDDVATAIIDYAARTKADLIAIATTGRGGMSRFVLGSVADEVTRKAPLSVLAFHPKCPSAAVAPSEHSIEETLAGV